jgi:hypothetical protein
VLKYLDVFATVFVKRSGLFRSIAFAADSGPNAVSLTSNCLPLTGFQGGLSYLGTISILLMSICVSPRYSAVVINRGCGLLGCIAYFQECQEFRALIYGTFIECRKTNQERVYMMNSSAKVMHNGKLDKIFYKLIEVQSCILSPMLFILRLT